MLRHVFLHGATFVFSRYTTAMNTELDIVLASGSPRRRELLEAAGIPFRVIVSDADESNDDVNAPADLAMANARQKAQAVAATLSSSSVVIGADTIVVLDGRVFGKPKGEEDAKGMLRELSDRTHEVITGVCIVRDGEAETFAETTRITFKHLSDEEIDAYVATGEPLDKAGAYGIQGGAGTFASSIDGDYDNVVGLPVARLQGALDLKRRD